jgi:MraZ protein
MFRGRNDCAIDDKGRVMLPVKFRETLSKKDETTLILTNLDDCLLAYPTSAWSEIEKNILSRPVRTTAERNFKRFLIGGVQECTIDKQGRILVPHSLRQYAGFDKDVVIAGQIDHFEIWSLDRYHNTIQQGQQSTETDDIRALRHDVGL